MIRDTAGTVLSDVISMVTEHLSTLVAYQVKQTTGDFLPVSRIVLHRLLTTGIEDRINYGHRFEKVESLQSGGVKVTFTNGTSVEGDLLIAADGVNSAIRKQLLPAELGPQSIGIDAWAGKIFLSSPEEVKQIAPMKRGVSILGSTTGRGAFMAPQVYSPEAKEKITKM